MPAYGDAHYWDERYQREPTCFDWYQAYSGLAPILQKHIPTSASILQVGVGSSRLQQDMVEQGGYQQVLNIDISTVVVKHMQELHKSILQLKYRIGDARSMPEYKDESFDSIIDKGTLDAILCGEQAGANAAAMLDECYRVLRLGGTLMLVTYGEPCSRLPLLMQSCFLWNVCLYVMGKHADVGLQFGAQLSPIIQGPIDAHSLSTTEHFTGLTNAHFVYVCTKHNGGSSSTASGSGCSSTTAA